MPTAPRKRLRIITHREGEYDIMCDSWDIVAEPSTGKVLKVNVVNFDGRKTYINPEYLVAILEMP